MIESVIKSMKNLYRDGMLTKEKIEVQTQNSNSSNTNEIE